MRGIEYLFVLFVLISGTLFGWYVDKKTDEINGLKMQLEEKNNEIDILNQRVRNLMEDKQALKNRIDYLENQYVFRNLSRDYIKELFNEYTLPFTKNDLEEISGDYDMESVYLTYALVDYMTYLYENKAYSCPGYVLLSLDEPMYINGNEIRYVYRTFAVMKDKEGNVYHIDPLIGTMYLEDYFKYGNRVCIDITTGTLCGYVENTYNCFEGEVGG